MASIQQMPDDVLLQIFNLSLEVQGTLPPLPHDARRALTQVCSGWRALITASPTFWQNVGFSPATFQHPTHLLHLAKQWRKRSGSLPIFLDLCKDFRHPTSQVTIPQRVEELLYGGGAFSIVNSILLPSAARITSLTCFLCANDIMTFLRLPEDTFPAIERIDIAFLNNFAQPHSAFSFQQCLSFTVFRSVPRLREATVHLFNGIHPLDLRLPWAQLTKLDFSSSAMSPNVFLRIMHHSSPTLCDASFQVEFVHDPHPVPRQLAPRRRVRILMPYLERLRLRLVDSSCDPSFFKRLLLPAVRYFRIERADQYEGWRVKLYTPTLATASNTLQQLDLVDVSDIASSQARVVPNRRQTSYQEMERLFKTLPRLRSLRLSFGVYVHAPTIAKLASGELLPLLQALELSTTCLASGEHILSMVKARNDMAFYRRLLRDGGTSLPYPEDVDPLPSLFPLSYVFLAVLPEEVMHLEEQATTLRLAPSCESTRIVIEGRKR